MEVLRARDVMKTPVKVVDPEKRLTELEREFLSEKVGAFPVVSQGKLVGLVSRSDVLRQLCVEQSLAENVSDADREGSKYSVDPGQSLEEIGNLVGHRIEDLRVKDVMIRRFISVRPEQSITELAKTLCDHGIHRVPVTEGDRLLGIVSSLDLVGLFAEEQEGGQLG